MTGLIAPRASACNVPVFRYALERWQPDSYQLIVFHRGELTAAQTSTIEQLRAQSLSRDGGLNLEVLTADVAAELDGELARIWQSEKDRARLPWTAFRAAPVRGERRILWRGQLGEFDPESWFQSPLRAQLLERLLAGDSGVWLVFPGDDAEQTSQMVSVLKKELERLGNELPFPEGIGLPGSEVYSPIPLTIRFSVLQADPAEEVQLAKLFATMANVEVDGTEPFAVPVFGRGRALEAFPAKMVNKGLIEEVSQFFTGACSCQVKQSNPGFDLPLSADWMPLLFEDLLPPAEQAADPLAKEGKPEYVALPKGQLAGNGAGSEDEDEEDPRGETSQSAEPTEPDREPPAPSAKPMSHDVEMRAESPAADAVVPSGKRSGNGPAAISRWISLAVVALGMVLIVAAFRR